MGSVWTSIFTTSGLMVAKTRRPYGIHGTLFDELAEKNNSIPLRTMKLQTMLGCLITTRRDS
jgi:hypothetical protein